MLKQTYIFSDYEQIIKSVCDDAYLWSVSKTVDGRYWLEKRSIADIDTVIFQVELDDSITAVNSLKVMTINSQTYIGIAVDSVEVVAFICEADNPLAGMTELVKPVGITDNCSDIDVLDDFIYALIYSETELKLLKYNYDVYEDTFSIVDGGYDLTKGLCLACDTTTIFITTNTNPINIVRFIDQSGGGTFTVHTLSSGEISPKRAIYYQNELYLGINTSPTKLVRITVGSGEVMSHFSFATIYDDLVDIDYRTDYIYITLESGKIGKFNVSTEVLEYIDTAEVENLGDLATYKSGDAYSFVNKTGTNILLYIDESELTPFSTDIRTRKEYYKSIETDVAWTNGWSSFSTDIRIRDDVRVSFGTDIRYIKYEYVELINNMVKTEDLILKIDDVSISDIQLSSISVSAAMDNTSAATFNLIRKFTSPDYTLASVYSQITNKNVVTIYLQDRQIFEGKVTQIKDSQNSEMISVQADGVYNSDLWVSYKIPHDMNSIETLWHTHKTINVALPSQDEQISVFHAMNVQVNINNPLTPIESNPLDPSVDATLYKGIRVNLGTKKTEKVVRGVEYIANADELNEWKPKQNREYFFVVNATRFDPFNEYPEALKTLTNAYIGTDLTINDDLWSLSETNAIVAYWQRIYDTVEEELGYYEYGVYPFKEISIDYNGKYIASERYEDRVDGLYLVKNDQYDYVEYARKMAYANYHKLDVYNTNVSFDMSLDAFLFYDLHLLDKINLSNTNQSGIYMSPNNGFPLSIKEIVIDADNMLCHIVANSYISSLEGWTMFVRVFIPSLGISYFPGDAEKIVEEGIVPIKLYSKIDPKYGEVE